MTEQEEVADLVESAESKAWAILEKLNALRNDDERAMYLARVLCLYGINVAAIAIKGKDDRWHSP